MFDLEDTSITGFHDAMSKYSVSKMMKKLNATYLVRNHPPGRVMSYAGTYVCMLHATKSASRWQMFIGGCPACRTVSRSCDEHLPGVGLPSL